jgi:hypothetical protein
VGKFGAFDVAAACHISVGNDDIDLEPGRYEPVSVEEFNELRSVAEANPAALTVIEMPPAGAPEASEEPTAAPAPPLPEFPEPPPVMPAESDVEKPARARKPKE